VTIVGVSLLLRRSFCSWICPVATVSECAWKTGFRRFRCTLRLPHRVDFLLRSLKYLMMFFFIYTIVIAMSTDALRDFIFSDYHKLADVRLLNFFLHISPVAMGIILALLAASFVLRNPFCRYLCPYGALLGLVAMLSPLRITRESSRCVSCGVCNQLCPSGIDVMHQESVNSPECIGCWRCVSHCRVERTLTMRIVGRFAIPGIVFALLLLSLFIGGTVAGKVTGHWRTILDSAEYARLLGK